MIGRNAVFHAVRLLHICDVYGFYPLLNGRKTITPGPYGVNRMFNELSRLAGSFVF